MSFVLDSSLTLAFVLVDEATAASDKVLDSFGDGEKAFVPALWWWEVSNALFQAERQKRIQVSETAQHLKLLKALPIELDEQSTDEAWASSLLLARKYNITVYDAAYLELAARLGLALGTLDKTLRKAAKSEGVKLFPENI